MPIWLLLALPLLAPALASDGASRGFAVVELFTSEGCSSCPPADQLLSDIARDASAQGTPVYALAFHVPWWDTDSWRDRFSDERYGERQQSYGDQFKLGNLYTPQMVINGRSEFIGSNTIKARSAIARGLATPSQVSLSVSVEPLDGDALSVTVAIEGAPDAAVLNVALVQDGLTSAVTGGENRGRRLVHNKVVRDFVTAPAAGAGTVALTLPPDLDPTGASVVAYLQRAATLEILGASAAALPTALMDSAQPLAGD